MLRLKKLLLVLLIISGVLAILPATTLAQSNAAVRFVHLIPDAVPVDVYVNGTLTVRGLDFQDYSNYINVPAGDHTVTAVPAGLATTLWEQSVTVNSGESITFIASDSSVPQFDAFPDNLTTTAFGSSRLLLVHALAGAPAVDVQLAEPVLLNGVEQAAGTVIASQLSYGGSFGAFDLPAQTYVVNVLPNEGGAFASLLSNVALPLASGTSYMAVVGGTADAPVALLLPAATNAAADSGFVRFVHGVAGAPAADVLVNDTLIAPALTPDMPSAHIALPAGEHTVEYALPDASLTTTITVSAGAAQTVAALSLNGELTASVFEDDLSGVSETSAAATVLNAIDGSTATVMLGNGTSLGQTDAGDSAATVTLDPVSTSTSFTIELPEGSGTLTDDNLTVYGGVYYNVIVLDGAMFSGPRLVVAETALAQGLNSAPGAETSSIVTGDVSQPEQTDSTEAPAETVEMPVQAPVTPPPADVNTAEVALDPSANLQLRQFPNAEALSLGLAPSGITLIVNGREGRPVALVEGQDPPPEAEDYVDPVTLLADEDEDLEPGETWLNITYNTPDGGTITAWVLSQFLIVRDDEGDLLPLRDLETVARNIPGEANNTDIAPPEAQEDRVVAIVINLNLDANLNLRRTPETSGEILARLPLDTVIEMVGLIDGETFVAEEAEWAFVNYAPPEGGIISGWVSTGFVRYEWNGDSVDVEELLDRDLIDRIDPETRGEISAGAVAPSAPAVDPQRDAYVAEVLLDPGANLQFRRDPDSQSESLNLIPSGTQVIVDARTPAADWLRVTFEGETGWIASQFVSVTFNGDFVSDLTEIPIADGLETTTEDTNGN